MDSKFQEERKARAIAAVREVSTDITVKDVEGSKLVKVESGKLTGTIAGAKVHKLAYHIRYWDNDTHDLFMTTACGTARHSRTGGHYVNYYQRLGGQVTCSKCSAK